MNKIIPQHIAIVMDGNGRWAQKRGLLRIEGHRAGVNTVKNVIKYCLEYKISTLSLFAFSSENWFRPVEEVGFLMQLFVDALHKEAQQLHKNGVKLNFLGERQGLSELLCNEITKVEKLTKNNLELSLNIVVNYGGKWDILQATKKIVCKIMAKELTFDEINEENFQLNLSTQGLSDPDLFIRTSGEQRISNFFLWQLAYTELYFTEVLWPDFDKEQFLKALDNFHNRTRRYGKL